MATRGVLEEVVRDRHLWLGVVQLVMNERREKTTRRPRKSGVIEGLGGDSPDTGVRLLRRLLELCGDALSYLGSRGPPPTMGWWWRWRGLPTVLGYGVMLAVSYVGNDISRCRARDLKRTGEPRRIALFLNALVTC